MNRSITCIKTDIVNMGRKYPRFLYCETKETKSEGPFIIHAISPKFISQPEFDKKRNLTGLVLIDNWDNAEVQVRWEIEGEMRKWFHYSGRKYSSHPKDKILVALSKLDFLKDNKSEFTVDQAIEIVRICFPTLTKAINENHSSYGLKHLLERISGLFTPPNTRKYCSNDTLKEAFASQKFNFTNDGPNQCYNISEKDFSIIQELCSK